MKATDITGEQYGRLKVTSRQGTNAQGNAMWNCLCECGKSCVVRAADLRNGHTNSCGCFCEDQTSKANTTHGGTIGGREPEYKAWIGMRRRCYDPTHEGYVYYGGSGITVSPLWKDNYEQFKSDIGPKPSEHHSLERIVNTSNYEPGNVMWATRPEQEANRRPYGSAKPQLIRDSL